MSKSSLFSFYFFCLQLLDYLHTSLFCLLQSLEQVYLKLFFVCLLRIRTFYWFDIPWLPKSKRSLNPWRIKRFSSLKLRFRFSLFPTDNWFKESFNFGLIFLKIKIFIFMINRKLIKEIFNFDVLAQSHIFMIENKFNTILTEIRSNIKHLWL